jgi:hypothetical protein
MYNKLLCVTERDFGLRALEGESHEECPPVALQV